MFQSPQVIWPVPGNTITTQTGMIYTLGQPLNQGGYALVFQGVDIFENPLVLKVLKPMDRDFQVVQIQWNNEVNLFYKLRHPNIVTIYEAFICDNLFYIVLEKAWGNIGQYISKVGPQQESFVREIARQLLFAINFIHKNGVLHRDITVSNVLVFEGPQTKGPIFKIGDFGISKDFIIPWSEKTSHSVIAHPSFIPPELLDPQHPFSNERTDLYHLGLILLFCLRGRLPFNDTVSQETIRQLILDGVPRKQAEALQTPFANFVATLLRRHNDLRYPTALEAWKALKQITP